MNLIKHILLYHFFVCLFVGNLFSQPVSYQSYDQSNNIYAYLKRVSSEVTNNSLAYVISLDEWQQVRKQRYTEFIEMMGLTDVPFEEKRTALNVKVTGIIQQKGYHIRKLYYESLPGLYVPANLYVPDNITKPVPAIIYTCGHASTQKVNYQAHGHQFAQLGFVCLIIENIESGEVHGIHRGPQTHQYQWYSRGYTSGGVELWNTIRGVDLLCQLPEVDSTRIGATGTSGGGAYTFYIAAADSRIKAAAPSCGGGTVESHVGQGTLDHACDCMMPVNTYLKDFQDIGALIAPRSLMIVQSDRDQYYDIEAVRKMYGNIKNIYNLYGASENLSLFETLGPHSYSKMSRIEIFSYFIKQLMGKEVDPTIVDAYDESGETKLSANELCVFVNGTLKDDRTPTIQDSFVKLAQPPKIGNVEELLNLRNRVVSFLKEKSFSAFPINKSALNPKFEFRCENADKPYYLGAYREDYSFVTEQDWRLKVAMSYNSQNKSSKQSVLLVLKNSDEGQTTDRKSETEAYLAPLKRKHIFALFEPRGTGQTNWGQNEQWHIRRAAAWTGRTIASMRVYDVLRCMEFLRSLEGVDPNGITLVARGDMCVVALYAALLDGNIKELVLENPPATQNVSDKEQGRGPTLEILNCLRITDVSQVAGLFYPMKISIIGDLPPTYSWASSLYQRLGKEKNFVTLNDLQDW